jgi:uncharacterized protein YdaU (DUF1376 family)
VSLPYYSMYPKDFDSDDAVRAMEDCELGLYIRCLNHSWINDGLPADPEEIRRRFRDPPGEFARKWKRVELCFPVAPDGKRRNPRQERERAQAIAKSLKASANAKRSHYGRTAEAVQVQQSESAADAVQAQQSEGSARASGSGSGVGGEKGGAGEKTGMAVEPSLTRTTHSLCAEVQPILDDLDEIYRKAGAPIPERHKQVAWQLLLAIPPERRARVPNYCKWALVSGKWPNPAKTKALVNVLRDGDWDVEIAPRILPMPAASARELAQERAAEKFRRMP